MQAHEIFSQRLLLITRFFYIQPIYYMHRTLPRQGLLINRRDRNLKEDLTHRFSTGIPDSISSALPSLANRKKQSHPYYYTGQLLNKTSPQTKLNL